MLSCLKLGGSPWKLTAKITLKNTPEPEASTQRNTENGFGHLFYASLLLLSASPCPFKWFYTWKQLPSRKKKRTDSKRRSLFLKGFLKSWHCACLLWTMPWQMQELWFLNYLKVFLNVLYRENYFTYNSISVALADFMLTIYQIWKMSLNIEIYLKQQNCLKMRSEYH